MASPPLIRNDYDLRKNEIETGNRTPTESWWGLSIRVLLAFFGGVRRGGSGG